MKKTFIYFLPQINLGKQMKKQINLNQQKHKKLIKMNLENAKQQFICSFTGFLNTKINGINHLILFRKLIIKSSIMVEVNFFKRLVLQFDMFCSSQLLRYRSQTQFKTLTGGFISLTVKCIVAAGFASMVADTLNRVAITSSLVTQKSSNPPSSSLLAGKQGMFMLGLSIQSFDFSFQADFYNGPQYFTLMMTFYQQKEGVSTNITQVMLEKCTQQHWSMMSTQFSSNFDNFAVSSWLCLPIGSKFSLSGGFNTQFYQFMGIELFSCKNQTSNNNCAPQEQIDAFLANQQNFYMTWNYVNPVINPNKQDYISYYVEGGDYVIFSSKIGSEAWVYFSDYTITTDSSILPYESISTKIGCIVEQKAIAHPYTVSENGSFARIYLAKSENSLTYIRQVQKISAVFSYIGGLIGAITAVLFLIKSYTDTSLEVAVGLSLFKLSQEQKQNENKDQSKKDKQFNLFSFIRLTCYRLIKFCGWKGIFERAQRLQKCQEEAIKQMDVQLLLKRAIKLETCMSKLFTPQQLKEIREGQPITFKTAKNMRKLLFCQREVESNDERESIQESVKNHAQLLDTITDQPFKEGGLYAESGISFLKVKSDMIGDPSVYPSNPGEIDPSLKIEELQMVTRKTILRKKKMDEDAKAQFGQNDNVNVYPGDPVVKIYPPIII